TFFSYAWSLPLEQAIEGISTYQNFSFSESVPKEIGFELDLMKGTNKGEVTLNLVGSYYGSPDEFTVIVQPFLDAMPNQTSPAQFNVTSWLDNLVLLAGAPLASTPASVATENNTFYAKSLTTPSDQPMSQEAIAALASWMSVEGWYTETDWFVQLELYGGNSSRIGQIPSNATAYFNRHDLWTIQFYTSSPNAEPPFPREGFAFLDGLVASITANEPQSYTYGAYPNYVDPRLPPPEWHALYYGSNLERLERIKTDVDPQNVFRWPQSM
ncbi:berberine and berberine like-domain-containing protein, partial [Fomitopsis betulina]